MKNRLNDTMDWLKSKGIDYADARFTSGERESIRVTDGNIDNLSRNLDVGVGIRVLVNGAWGFASTSVTTPAALRKTANLAIKIAHASALTKREDVVLAEQQPFSDACLEYEVYRPPRHATTTKSGFVTTARPKEAARVRRTL